MKLRDVITEAEATPGFFRRQGVSFGGMQKKVYEFVIKKMKMGSSTTSFVSELARTTDTFWVHAFDDLLNELKKVRSMDRIEDELWNAIVEVNEKIVDYMGDAANHPPGYKVQKLRIIDEADVSLREMVALINDIDPQVAATLKKMADDDKAEQQARTAAAKAAAKEHLDEIVAALKKYNDKGWSEFWKVAKKVKEKSFPIDVNLGKFDDFVKQDIKSADDLKAYAKTFGQKKYMEVVVDNFFNLTLPKEDGMFIHHLFAIKSDAALTKKFLAKIDSTNVSE